MIIPPQTIAATPGLITPFRDRYVEHGMSGGLGCAGYDIAIDQDLWLWPGAYRLASSVERFRLPDDMLMMVVDKSTWARRGVTVQHTCAEPGWTGYLTLEIANHGWRLVRIRRGMPMAQAVFHRIEAPTDRPYRGKYQGQRRGPVPAMMEGVG